MRRLHVVLIQGGQQQSEQKCTQDEEQSFAPIACPRFMWCKLVSISHKWYCFQIKYFIIGFIACACRVLAATVTAQITVRYPEDSRWMTLDSLWTMSRPAMSEEIYTCQTFHNFRLYKMIKSFSLCAIYMHLGDAYSKYRQRINSEYNHVWMSYATQCLPHDNCCSITLLITPMNRCFVFKKKTVVWSAADTPLETGLTSRAHALFFMIRDQRYM